MTLTAEPRVLQTRTRELELPAPPRAWIDRSLRAEALVDEGERLMVARSEAVATELGLTPREREVLVELMRCDSYDEIVAELGIARSTVRTHAKRVFEKTQTRSRHALTLFVAFGIRPTRASDEAEHSTALSGRTSARAKRGRSSSNEHEGGRSTRSSPRSSHR